MIKKLPLISNIILLSALVCIIGCGGRGLISLYRYPDKFFGAQTKTAGNLSVRARVCSHAEINRYFSDAEDFYHYYYLVHVRFENAGYSRYTLSADKSSFFVPPATVLKKYTQSEGFKVGWFTSLFSTLLFTPVYIINIFKETLEEPYLIASTSPERYIVVTSHFAFLSGLYALVSIGPLIVSTIINKMSSERYFREAKSLILTQRKELSLPPYKTRDVLFFTPRASFSSRCSVALYNHKSNSYEHVVLKLKLPK